MEEWLLHEHDYFVQEKIVFHIKKHFSIIYQIFLNSI